MVNWQLSRSTAVDGVDPQLLRSNGCGEWQREEEGKRWWRVGEGAHGVVGSGGLKGRRVSSGGDYR